MSKLPPWQVEDNPWGTEAKFITWIRGVLRKGWSKYPLKHIFKQSKRKRIKNPNPKPRKGSEEVWGLECDICHNDFVQTEIEIDHIGDQGSLKCFDDIKGYAEHLFMLTYEDMRCICKGCHKIVSQSQRSGVSFEEAKLEKLIIEKCKLKTDVQLALLSGYGYNDCSNKDKRKAAWQEILRKELNNE